MHSRILMMTSAAFLAVLGLATSYMPQEVLGLHGTVPDTPTLLLVQMAGALYLGFAILNWTARGILIGGIYARPVALGNFLHSRWWRSCSSKPRSFTVLYRSQSVRPCSRCLRFGLALCCSNHRARCPEISKGQANESCFEFTSAS